MIRYDSFELSSDDTQAIAAARKTKQPWDDPSIADLKRRLKLHCLALTDEHCCYCRRNLRAEFQMVIDVEHVLPKSIYSELTFELVNLAASCKRCNMQIKRLKVDFLVSPSTVLDTYRESSAYLFLHPNLDDYSEHLGRLEIAIDRKRILKYVVRKHSEKGEFTYNYFRLREFEVASFDIAQGRVAPDLDAQSFLREALEALENPTAATQRRGADGV